MDRILWSWIAASIGALGFFFLLTWIVGTLSEGRRLLRLTSRFPLFAARDRLVLLVAQGEVSEESEAWKIAYATVNSALDLTKSLHLLDIKKRIVRHLLDSYKDGALRERAARAIAILQEESGRNARFAGTIEEIEQAFCQMVFQRTRTFHRVLVWLWIRAVTWSLEGWAYAEASRAASRPSRDELVGLAAVA